STSALGTSTSSTTALGTSTGAGTTAAATGTTGALTSEEAGLSVANLPRPFSPDSPWSTAVTSAQISSDSQNLMRQAETRYGVVTLNGGATGSSALASNLETLQTHTVRLNKPLFINTTIWTDPIIPSAGGENVTLVCRQINLPPPRNNCGDGWNLPSLPIEQSAFPKPQYDGWMT